MHSTIFFSRRKEGRVGEMIVDPPLLVTNSESFFPFQDRSRYAGGMVESVSYVCEEPIDLDVLCYTQQGRRQISVTGTAII